MTNRFFASSKQLGKNEVFAGKNLQNDFHFLFDTIKWQKCLVSDQLLFVRDIF